MSKLPTGSANPFGKNTWAFLTDSKIDTKEVIKSLSMHFLQDSHDLKINLEPWRLMTANMTQILIQNGQMPVADANDMTLQEAYCWLVYASHIRKTVEKARTRHRATAYAATIQREPAVVVSMDISLPVVQGNLFDAKEQYIAHQCNCVTDKGAHLAGDLFVRFPYANIYAERRMRINKQDMPGTILVRGSDHRKDRFVINMLGQRYPGASKYDNDTYAMRQEWFQSALNEISLIANLKSIAFPKNIGCGAAGGHWPNYLMMLEDFAKSMPAVRVVLYDYTPPTTTTTPIMISHPPATRPIRTMQNYMIRKERVAAASSVPTK